MLWHASVPPPRPPLSKRRKALARPCLRPRRLMPAWVQLKAVLVRSVLTAVQLMLSRVLRRRCIARVLVSRLQRAGRLAQNSALLARVKSTPLFRVPLSLRLRRTLRLCRRLRQTSRKQRRRPARLVVRPRRQPVVSPVSVTLSRSHLAVYVAP